MHCRAGRTSQALLSDRGLEVLRREIGKLQRQRGERREPFRLRGAKLGRTSTVSTHLPLTLTGRRGGIGCARAASRRLQLQKSIPVAVVPFRKFLRGSLIASL